MKCPKCGSYNTKVMDTLPAEGDLGIYRRRTCTDCKSKFRSIEVVDDGSEEFNSGYLKALECKSGPVENLIKYRKRR